jgi:hypothetical protein
VCGGSNAHPSTDTRHQNELAGCENTQWNSNVINDVALPKFVDATRQNAVQFLYELDSFFSLKHVPESLKLHIALKAIGDSYAKQWLESVGKDLKNYSEFSIAFTELLWNTSVQAQVRNSIYQDKYSKQSGESFSAHFLKHSVRVAYLSNRMSEIDLVPAIATHFPAYVSRSILSDNVSTIQGALTFIRRLEALEPQELGQQSSPTTEVRM